MGQCCLSAENPVWDRFVRVRFLGDGGSCTVWLARDKKSSRGDAWCAVKLIPKKKPAAASFYEHEIQILKLLAHPQILPLIDAFECPDDYVVVTPFLSGGELFAKLRTIDHYDEQTASKMAKKMLQALYYCHKHDVVHRDLKPENYVFTNKTANAELILIDFGEALHIKENESCEEGVGTPFYTAPEIFDADFTEPHTGKVLKCSDMWSLGIIFFMMLTGYPPFDDQNDDVVFEKILLGKYEWPSDIQVSDSAKDLVSKMLTLNYKDRITAADALNHPWITNNNNSSVSLNAMKTFHNYSAAARMKQAVANLLVKTISPEDSQNLRQLFAQLDVDGDGLLDLQELMVYMKDGSDDAGAQAKAFLQSVDETKRGAINFAEFEAAHYRGQLGSDSTAIRRAFDSFDAQHTGVIQLSDVRAVLGDEGAAAVEELVSAVGSYKGDGQISFQTFLEAMTSENVKSTASKSPSRMRSFSVASPTLVSEGSRTFDFDTVKRPMSMFSRGNLPTLVSTSSTGSDGESLLVVTEEDVVLEDETVSPLRQRAHSRSRSGSVKFKKAVF